MNSFMGKRIIYSAKDCKQTVSAFLEMNKDAFINGQAPDVIVHIHVPEDQAFICSTKDGETASKEKLW